MEILVRVVESGCSSSVIHILAWLQSLLRDQYQVGRAPLEAELDHGLGDQRPFPESLAIVGTWFHDRIASGLVAVARKTAARSSTSRKHFCQPLMPLDAWDSIMARLESGIRGAVLNPACVLGTYSRIYHQVRRLWHTQQNRGAEILTNVLLDPVYSSCSHDSCFVLQAPLCAHGVDHKDGASMEGLLLEAWAT